jgi:ATP-dependent Clp protease ATP-binding subunit ClpA
VFDHCPLFHDWFFGYPVVFVDHILLFIGLLHFIFLNQFIHFTVNFVIGSLFVFHLHYLIHHVHSGSTDLLAGTKWRGEFEEKVKWLIDDAKSGTYIDEHTQKRRVSKKGNPKESKVYFFDELHTLVGRAGNLLKPALSRGEFVCMGATTIDEFAKYFEGDAALTRRFQSVTVGEPTLAVTREILLGLRSNYEAYHNVFILDEAIDGAINLSDEYIKYRNMPDKAIDVLDEACARLKLNLREYSTEILKIQEGIAKLSKERRKAHLEVLEISSEEAKKIDPFHPITTIELKVDKRTGCNWNFPVVEDNDNVDLPSRMAFVAKLISDLVWTSAKEKDPTTVHSENFRLQDELLSEIISATLSQWPIIIDFISIDEASRIVKEQVYQNCGRKKRKNSIF